MTHFLSFGIIVSVESEAMKVPRQARQFGDSGYLHLIVRGIGKQILFEDRQDRVYYLSILRRFCAETGVSVLAYCLMENHVHILVYDEKQQTPLLMKKLGVSYSSHFNRKYERSGHLFQDRYLSQSIEDERGLLTVFRYILNNPQRAGLGPASSYEWSSYGQYGDPEAFTETQLLCELIGDRAAYDAFLAEGNEDRGMEADSPRRDDEWAGKVLRRVLGSRSGTSLQSLERTERDAALRALKAEGLSVRQLERLTGINRGVIQRA